MFNHVVILNGYTYIDLCCKFVIQFLDWNNVYTCVVVKYLPCIQVLWKMYKCWDERTKRAFIKSQKNKQFEDNIFEGEHL